MEPEIDAGVDAAVGVVDDAVVAIEVAAAALVGVVVAGVAVVAVVAVVAAAVVDEVALGHRRYDFPPSLVHLQLVRAEIAQ